VAVHPASANSVLLLEGRLHVYYALSIEWPGFILAITYNGTTHV
jgi:hypothetical protein